MKMLITILNSFKFVDVCVESIILDCAELPDEVVIPRRALAVEQGLVVGELEDDLQPLGLVNKAAQ